MSKQLFSLKVQQTFWLAKMVCCSVFYEFQKWSTEAITAFIQDKNHIREQD